MESCGRSVGPFKRQLLLFPLHFLNSLGDFQKHIGTLWLLLGSHWCYLLQNMRLLGVLRSTSHCASEEIPSSYPLPVPVSNLFIIMLITYIVSKNLAVDN
jgi:hypothetical protein